MWVYLNDRFVRREEAKISVFDHGFLYGDGVYETLRAYGGRLFMVQQHVARLRRSSDLIGLEIPVPEHRWESLLNEALERNGLRNAKGQAGPEPPDGYLRITLSRGEGEIGLDPKLCGRPTLLLIAKPLTPYPAHFYDQGVRLVIVSVRRNLATALPPQIKSLNFLNNILAKRESTEAGVFDAIMLNADGKIAECTASNIFFIHHGVLHTPSLSCGILDGITRAVVITLSRENGIVVEEGAYTAEALLRAEECFLTNTSMEVMPVSEVGGTKIGPGQPGPTTRRLRELFRLNLSRFLD